MFLWLPFTMPSKRPFFHWPTMPNRFMTRITVIAFHKSPPRGVGMLRLVSSCAISRYGISHISRRIGRRIASRAAAASVIHLADVGIAELYATALSGAERNLGSF